MGIFLNSCRNWTFSSEFVRNSYVPNRAKNRLAHIIPLCAWRRQAHRPTSRLLPPIVSPASGDSHRRRWSAPLWCTRGSCCRAPTYAKRAEINFHPTPCKHIIEHLLCATNLLFSIACAGNGSFQLASHLQEATAARPWMVQVTSSLLEFYSMVYMCALLVLSSLDGGTCCWEMVVHLCMLWYA